VCGFCEMQVFSYIGFFLKKLISIIYIHQLQFWIRCFPQPRAGFMKEVPKKRLSQCSRFVASAKVAAFRTLMAMFMAQGDKLAVHFVIPEPFFLSPGAAYRPPTAKELPQRMCPRKRKIFFKINAMAKIGDC
jgi:hypothetical protein